MKKIAILLVLGVMIGGLIHSCRKDEKRYIPTPMWLDIPDHFPPMKIPEDNPITQEGVALGRKLFYDPILSSDFTISCASCHKPGISFTDDRAVSLGVEGREGIRHSMALVNLGWQDFFFWDGRSKTLEEQIFHPVPDVNEMDLPWMEAVKRLEEHDDYPDLFHMAFGEEGIDSVKASKSIAQFIRTMISGNSKFDLFYKRNYGFDLTDQELQASYLTVEELEGRNLFMSESADCFHCHNEPLLHVNMFSNNGLDATFDDLGLGGITGSPEDMGKFKVPTLRNIALTAPYMHDGRFETLEEVINHYNFGLQNSTTIDPLMKFVYQGGIQLNAQQRASIKKFLLTFTDDSFITNPAFQPPN